MQPVLFIKEDDMEEVKKAIETVCEFCKKKENYWLSECASEKPDEIFCPVALLVKEYVERED